VRKILTVVGARPQFVKASVVSRALKRSEGLREVLVHTGQHFDRNMSDIFFSELNVPAPAYNLGVSGGSHGAMTGQMLAEIERVLNVERPDAVLVYGDTNSTLAGALAAVKLHIPVAHVEAGLRSFNMRMPEEVNRILTDRISSWLFTPTATAINNLSREGFPAERIIPSGDVMLDMARIAADQAGPGDRLFESLQVKPKEYFLATVHRAENTDNSARLRTIVESLGQLSKHATVVWPVHPRTRSVLAASAFSEVLRSENVRLIDPVGYLDMVRLERGASVIITDSGGVQKEAYFFKAPCVTLRDETEWVELVEAGWNRLVSPVDADSIVSAVLASEHTQGQNLELYGDGRASDRIASRLAADLS
jgi:UDP-GlcNAc3NAcA epimerase